MGFRAAHLVCRALPPALSGRARERLLPPAEAAEDDTIRTGRTVNGATFIGETSDFHSGPLLVEGFYEWRNVAIAQAVVPKGGTIVEVGGNVGTETVSFAAVVGPSGTVVTFEPEPANLAWLERNAACNPSLHIDIRPHAVGDAPGEITFHLPPRALSGQGWVEHGDEPVEPAPGWDRVTVPVRPLDAELADLRRVDLVAIDAEGSEPMVLDGAAEVLARHRPAVIVEANAHALKRNGRTLADLKDQLAGLGYTAFMVRRFALEPVPTDPTGRGSDWLCLPEEDVRRAARIERRLRRSFLLPPIPHLNPLATR